MEVGNKYHEARSLYKMRPLRSNLLLQMLMHGNWYVSFIWSVSYLFHMLFWYDRMWSYTGLAMIFAYMLAVCAEIMRLHASYSINLCTRATSMWLLLTLTPCILLPALVYLRLATFSGDTWLHFISNLQLLLIALEALVALIYHALYTHNPAEPLEFPALQLQTIL